MKARLLPIAALGCALMVAVLSQNLFGRELNALFIRFPGIDKLLHVVEYALVFVALNALARRVLPPGSGRLRLALAGGVLLAVVDESVQRLAPYRNVESFDVLADVAGLALGWVSTHRPRPQVAATAVAAALCVTVYVTWDTYARLSEYSRGLRYSQRQDFVRAREHLRRALDSGLRSPALLNELAWVEVESGIGNPSRAVEFAGEALEIQPENPDILDTYGWALHHAGRSREALTPLLDAYQRKPDIFCIHYHLGAVYLALGKRKLAQEHLRRQVERDGTREAVFARRVLAEMVAQ